MIHRMCETEPLRIALLAAGYGLLGLTVCPGKQSDSLYGPPLQRDLDRDLDRIQAWGASHLITLLEARELVELKVPDLGAAVEAKGIRWHHLPTPDAQAPGAGVSGVESCLSEEVRCCLMGQETSSHPLPRRTGASQPPRCGDSDQAWRGRGRGRPQGTQGAIRRD